MKYEKPMLLTFNDEELEEIIKGAASCTGPVCNINCACGGAVN